MYLLKKL